MENKNREKQILNRGYVTNALTDGKKPINFIGEIYSFIDNKELYYWSEVYVEGNMAFITKKGINLSNSTRDQLLEYQEQSYVNLGSKKGGRL